MKSNIKEQILNCKWPQYCPKAVKDGIWDYEDVVDYFQRLDDSPDILLFINCSERFGYMVPGLTKNGLLYFLPKLMVGSLEDLDSELTTGLLDVLYQRSQTEDAFCLDGMLTRDQISCLELYLRFYLANNPSSIRCDEATHLIGRL